MQADDLLIPCPFCGVYEGDADGTLGDWWMDLEIEEEDYEIYPSSLYYVKCINCNCQGPTARSRDGAIARWNHRVVR